MVQKSIIIFQWVKVHVYELFAGSVGFISTITVDWNHIAERAIETFIMATVNGAAAAAAGYLSVFILKKVFKKDVRNIDRNTGESGKSASL